MRVKIKLIELKIKKYINLTVKTKKIIMNNKLKSKIIMYKKVLIVCSKFISISKYFNNLQGVAVVTY